MFPILLKITIRLALCAAATFVFWHWMGFGVFGLVFMAPLYGIALARPIQDLIEETNQETRAYALRDMQGKHYVHRGIAMDIEEDDDGVRWLLLEDAGKAIPGLPQEQVLRRYFPQGIAELPDVPGVRIRADAVVEYLKKSTEPNSLKFRNWLQKDVLRSVSDKRLAPKPARAPAAPD